MAFGSEIAGSSNPHGNLAQIHFRTEYRSIKDDPARDFFSPCLLNSVQYKRAVGYFRSTVFSVVGRGVIEFARRGGRAKVICSPELSQEDIESIALGYARRSDLVETRLLEEIETLSQSTDIARDLQILATLVATGVLDIKIAVRADRKGLYHEKLGLFQDGFGNTVSFKGSANETWSGWHSDGNFESIEVFCDWRGGWEAERVDRHGKHFDTLWSERDPDVEVFPFPPNAVTRLKAEARGSLDEIETTQIRLPDRKRAPLQHQIKAIRSWTDQHCRGILQHATGSGKTYTALLAIKEQITANHPVLIVVPSRLLLRQWAEEIRQELPQPALLLAGGGHRVWRKQGRLSAMTSPDPTLGGRIVIATMQTAASPDFLNAVGNRENLMLVADEVHQVGSPKHLGILTIAAQKRLGLSATPSRYGDPDGTERIFDYFGGIVPPPITLEDAISAGRLVPYEYRAHPVRLDMAEAEEWRRYTEEVRREIARHGEKESGRIQLTERARLLLIQRARIAKRAQAKIPLACEVLKEYYRDGQGWLVYCEDKQQLGAVRQALREIGFSPVEYFSDMEGGHAETMAWFKQFGGILLSIRCLDEGVDIPDVSHALILASSQNPRQFIQRRGRVLRRAPNKQLASIHDALVEPVDAEKEPEQVGLLAAELTRAVEFARSAINRSAEAELRNIAIEAGIDPDTLYDIGIEEDD
jgi:superfamily II DNA or RNA helicase